MRITEISANPSSPTDAAWQGLDRELVRLVPVPLEHQPNEYIRAAWRERPYGRAEEVAVATARCGSRLFVHLAWADSPEPNREFLDGAAVFFPSPNAEDAPLTIGTWGSPVRLWAWRDRLASQQSLPAAKELLAMGPGIFRPLGQDGQDGQDGHSAQDNQDSQDGQDETPSPSSVSAESELSDGRWAVVVSGDIAAAASARRMGVVVWDGSNEERAGIAAVTPSWVPLGLD